MEKKILHIVSDEKIIDRTIGYFEEAYPDRNRFIVIVSESSLTLKFVKRVDKVEILSIKDKRLIDIGNNTEEYEHVLVHMLNDRHIRFINAVNHPNITWINWGADLYSGLLTPKGYQLYRESSYKYVQDNKKWKRTWLYPLAILVEKIGLGRRIRALNKLNNIAINDVDYALLTTYYPDAKKINRVGFFYYPIDSVLGIELKESVCKGNRIIVGNSASPTGNHMEVLEELNKKCANCEVIVPVSYGDNNYRDLIIAKAKRFTNLNLSFLIDYMSLKDYNKVLLGCGNYIYGNLRQEAVGNINVGIYLGAKIFLDRKNPLFKLYNNMGIKVFSLDEIDNEIINTPLSQDIIARNRAIIHAKYNHNYLIKLIKKSFPLN